jgi:hypothetical protein
VIDSIDGRLGGRLVDAGKFSVELGCTLGVLAERLLHRDAAAGRQPVGTDGPDRFEHQPGRKSQVYRDRTRSGSDAGNVQDGGDVTRLGDIGPVVVQSGGDRVPVSGTDRRRVL